jgi:hypothetical protein
LKTFELKRDEVTGDWRRLHTEIHSLYSSPNIIRIIKSRRIRWTGFVVRMGDMRNATKFWLKSLKVRNHSQDLGVDGRVMLKWIIGKCGLDSYGS